LAGDAGVHDDGRHFGLLTSLGRAAAEVDDAVSCDSRRARGFHDIADYIEGEVIAARVAVGRDGRFRWTVGETAGQYSGMPALAAAETTADFLACLPSSRPISRANSRVVSRDLMGREPSVSTPEDGIVSAAAKAGIPLLPGGRRQLHRNRHRGQTLHGRQSLHLRCNAMIVKPAHRRRIATTPGHHFGGARPRTSFSNRSGRHHHEHRVTPQVRHPVRHRLAQWAPLRCTFEEAQAGARSPRRLHGECHSDSTIAMPSDLSSARAKRFVTKSQAPWFRCHRRELKVRLRVALTFRLRSHD